MLVTHFNLETAQTAWWQQMLLRVLMAFAGCGISDTKSCSVSCADSGRVIVRRRSGINCNADKRVRNAQWRKGKGVCPESVWRSPNGRLAIDAGWRCAWCCWVGCTRRDKRPPCLVWLRFSPQAQGRYSAKQIERRPTWLMTAIWNVFGNW